MKTPSTDRLGRLFFNVVALESRSPESVVTNKKNTTDAGLRHSRITSCDERRSGFTLIELLVVVLIIGILSAIALPQYERAVNRSRTAEALAVLRSTSQAAEAHIMETGEWPASWDAVSVRPSGPYGTYRVENDTVTSKYYKYILINGRIDATPIGDADAGSLPALLYVSDLAKGMTAPVAGKKLYCYYVANGTDRDSKMESVCKSMGGTTRHAVTARSIWFPL